jgi:hypothetical protein
MWMHTSIIPDDSISYKSKKRKRGEADTGTRHDGIEDPLASFTGNMVSMTTAIWADKALH